MEMPNDQVPNGAPDSPPPPPPPPESSPPLPPAEEQREIIFLEGLVLWHQNEILKCRRIQEQWDDLGITGKLLKRNEAMSDLFYDEATERRRNVNPIDALRTVLGHLEMILWATTLDLGYIF